jgi:dTDP-glucose pyrophosphorylase/CBS domain-containing protein
MTAVEPLLVDPSTPVREVIACIDRNATGIALVVDPARRLIGAITDGDVRRAILSGLDLEHPAERLLERKEDEPYRTPVTARAGTPDAELLHLMNTASLRHIPLVDEGNRVVDVALMTDLVQEYDLPLTAVVMAGGKGTRLGPLTRETPKPMLPVGDRPLLEHIVEQLQTSGISRVALTTHYKSEVISEHFGDGRDFGVDIEYFAEDEPLGTAGGLSLVPDTDEPLLVMNGDILTRVNFRALLDFHREHEAAMTVCVRQEELKLPYGLVEADGEAVTGIDEKPTITHFINAGIYLIDPVARPYVPRGTAFEMPDLVARLIEHGLPVVRFPLREYWVDIGLTETYEQAGRDHAEGRVG